MNREAFTAALLDFVNGPLMRCRDTRRSIAPIDADTPLFAAGAIDSLGIIDLIAFVESTSGRPVPLRKIDMRFFGTVNRIVTAFWHDPEGKLS